MTEIVVEAVGPGKGAYKKVPVFFFEEVKNSLLTFLQCIEKIFKELLFLFRCLPLVHINTVIPVFECFLCRGRVNTHFQIEGDKSGNQHTI